MKKLKLLLLYSGCCVLLPFPGMAGVSYNFDIKPLLSNSCFTCHGPDEAERKAKLRLDTFEGATADLKGTSAIVPGDIDASELIYRITTDDPDEMMPPPELGKRLSTEQVELIRQWVKEGAKYEQHWSYQVPVRPKVPEISGNAINGIDAFLQMRLEKEGLSPSEEADRHALVRRVSLDLTGLPPSPEQVERFIGGSDR